jgi:anti-sigma factor RsiW
VRTERRGDSDTAFRNAREENVSVCYWIHRKFGYALSSADIGRRDLLKVANTVYRQVSP